MKKPQLLIFDVDGTILDSFDQLFLSIKDYIHIQNGKTLTQARFRELLLGNPWENILTEAGVKVTPKVEEIDEKRNYLPYRENKLFPGMKDLLFDLSEVNQMAIVTSTPIAQVTHVFEKRGIDTLFSAFLGPEISIYKHDKLKLLLDEFSLKPEDLLFITDTVGDIEESHNVSVPTVAVTWGFNTKEQLLTTDSEYLVDSVQGLRELLLNE